MDFMMDYFWIFMDSLRTHDAMADLYASSLVIFKHISESMTCGLSGLFYFDEMDMKILHWMAWKANLFC